jgi:hypothetical protein
MRICFSILFISILLSKIAYSVFWQVNFYLNQKEIAEKECENKNRPEMHCNGKCYLAKKLNKADAELESQKEKQEGSFSNLKIIEEGLFIPFSLDDFELKINHDDNKYAYFIYQNTYFFQVYYKFFHPPSSIINV